MLLSGKSLKHDFIRFVSTTMASQVVFSLYSMVDGLMVSVGVNEYAMSAVNLAIPFTNALFSIAVIACPVLFPGASSPSIFTDGKPGYRVKLGEARTDFTPIKLENGTISFLALRR